MLIDATYAGLLTGATETPLVIPALNRDGDCLSDMVLPMFGSIAGAESVLLAFDEDYDVEVAMAEAPHGTAPSLMGKDLANPMAMLLACGAVLHYGARAASRAPSAPRARSTRACWRRSRAGVKTIDLGGHATTSEFTDAVVEKVRTKVDVWSSLGSRCSSRRAHSNCGIEGGGAGWTRPIRHFAAHRGVNRRIRHFGAYSAQNATKSADLAPRPALLAALPSRSFVPPQRPRSEPICKIDCRFLRRDCAA